MTYPEFLYGRPDDESLDADPASVFERAWDDYEPEPGKPFELEIVEWRTAPPRKSLVDPDWITEHVLEMRIVDEPGDEFYYEAWEKASKETDVVAAFEAALQLWASKINYVMADERVRCEKVTIVGCDVYWGATKITSIHPPDALEYAKTVHGYVE